MKNTQYQRLIHNRINDFFYHKTELMKLSNIDEFECGEWKPLEEALIKISDFINDKYGLDRIV